MRAKFTTVICLTLLSFNAWAYPQLVAKCGTANEVENTVMPGAPVVYIYKYADKLMVLNTIAHHADSLLERDDINRGEQILQNVMLGFGPPGLIEWMQPDFTGVEEAEKNYIHVNLNLDKNQPFVTTGMVSFTKSVYHLCVVF